MGSDDDRSNGGILYCGGSGSTATAYIVLSHILREERPAKGTQ